VFNALAALSLLLLIATAGLWVCSYWWFIDAGRITVWRDTSGFTQHLIRLGCDRGRFLFTDRDLSWSWGYPPAARIVGDWERTRGIYFKREATFNLYQQFPKQPGELTWTKDFAGCRFKRLIESNGNAGRSAIGFLLIIPNAYACVAFAILPAAYAVRRRRLRLAIQQGLCLTCGYNLTGNVSGVCPECGAAIETRAP
jgi:hypothetical protein